MILITAIIIATTIQSTVSVKCYDCASPIDRNLACEVNPEAEAYTDCGLNSYCVQFQQIYPNQSIYNRRCVSDFNFCQNYSTVLGNNPAVKITGCEICNEDGCNNKKATITRSLAASVECYDCHGPLGRNLPCENNLEDPSVKNLVTCNFGTVCAQHVIKYPSERILTRGCATPGICEILNLQYQSNPEVSVAQCITCSTRGCNDQSGTAANFVSFGILATSLLIGALNLY